MAIDYRCYDIRNLFYMPEVALLWCDIEEITPANRHIVRSMLCAIREAIATGELVCEQSNESALASPPYANEAAFTRKVLERWAQMKEQRPKFLFPEMRDEKHARYIESAAMKERENDKAAVQAVALTLRDLNPGITSAALVKHKAVKVYANGGQWQPSTVKSWIREVDERPKNERAGRPRKTAPENIQPQYEDVGK